MKVGIVGLGKMGRNHLKELSKNANFKLNALFDVVKNDDFEFSFFTNLDDFLAQKNDIVIIATPTNTHLDVARKVFSKTKVVLIEKPLALNLKEMDELALLSKTYNNKVAVGFCERFNPVVLALKKEINSKEIISVNIQRFSSYPERISDVGILQDLGVHDLDLLLFLTREKFKQTHILKTFTRDLQRESESVIVCEIGQTIASLHQSWNANFRSRKITLVGKNAFYEGDLAEFSLRKNGVLLEFEKKSPLFNEHEELLKLANSKPNMLANIDEARIIQELLEQK